MANWQAFLMVKTRPTANGLEWECYCREPVASRERAQVIASSLARRLQQTVKLVLTDWDDRTNTSETFLHWHN